MGLQEYNTTASGCYMAGLLSIIGLMKKHKFIIDNVFDEHFIGCYDYDEWFKIRNTIEPHATNKIVATAKTPSKPNRQGDGTGTPFMVNKANSNLAYMYEYANGQGIIKNPDDGLLRIWFDPTGLEERNQEATHRWFCIISAYEQLFNIGQTISLVANSIRPLYMGGSLWAKSPGQLFFYGDKYFHGSIINLNNNDNNDYWFTGSGGTNTLNFCQVHWNCIELLDSIVQIIQTEDLNKLWYTPIPIVTFGSGGSSDTVPADFIGSISLSISDVPFATRVTVTDPGGGSQTNIYDGKIANVNTPSAPPSTFTVSSTYKKFTVTY